MALIPKKTIPLVVSLLVFIFFLLLLRLQPQPEPEPPSPLPVPSITAGTITISPTPNPTVPPATPSARLTPMINSESGWQVYQNYQYQFRLDYPPNWNLTEFSPPQPIVLVGTSEDNQITAFSLTLKDWPFEQPSDSASPSAFSYQGWQGTQTTSGVENSVVTMITAIKNGFRATYVQSGNQAVNFSNTLLKPILDSFSPLTP